MMFEWDSAKNDINWKKHQLRFETAIAIFNGIVFTKRSSHPVDDEIREISIGAIGEEVVLAVVHTDRTGTLRIISARRASRAERREYYDHCAQIIK